MPSFILHIFPESGLASSLITTVWIGVFVVCFFNLRFGWNLSGLIVPGYLVPLLILKPWSAVAIIIEALFTYFLIMFFSEFSSRLGRWSSLFGRDRFFAIILFSVVSRLLFDIILFPELTGFLSNYIGVTFVYKGGLYSIGLVIVALLANQFWNPGIKRGLPQFLITLFISFLIIRFVLLEFTNYRISEVAYLYEDIATSLAASPKAYIIFIVTAFLASRMNLLYGWEFGGIVLPALLALQWYYPWKIVSSILEAGIIYGLAVLILKTPLFRNITIEGARKILLFFNISFAYKMFIGFTLPLVIPNVRILNVYGLGYMLTSLIAIKMFDKKIGLKMTRTALQTSFLAVVLATIIGFVLLYVPTFETAANKKNDTAHYKSNKYRNFNSVSEAVLAEQIRLYGFLRKPATITQNQLISFKNSLTALKNYVIDDSEISLQYATTQLDYLGYKLDIINDKYILLYEESWKSSRGLYVIALNPDNNILVEVPIPTQGPDLIENAMLTVTEQNFAALAIAGGKNTLPDQLQENLSNKDSFYNIFCNVFNSTPTLQFFSQDKYLKSFFQNDKNINFIKHSVDYVYYPDNISKKKLETVSSFYPNLKKLKERPSFVQNNPYTISIFLSVKSKLETLIKKGKFDLDINAKINKKNFDSIISNEKGFLSSSVFAFKSLFSSKRKIKQKNQPLTIEKACFIDKQIITPIIMLTNHYSSLSQEARENKLKLISFAARIIGCSISTLTIQTLDSTYIILSGYNDADNEYLGGTFAFKTMDYTPCTVEILNPSNKNNLKLGSYLLADLKARTCFISGSAESSIFSSYIEDNSPTVRSLFNLANQIIIRETDAPETIVKKDKDYKSTIIQINTISNTNKTLKYIPNSIYFTTYYGKYKKSQLTKQEDSIYKLLKGYKINVLFDDGSPNTAGLSASHSLQTRYLPETKNTDFVCLWLTPKTKLKDSFFTKNKDKDNK